MKRVAIVGTPGAGKSTLARERGERFELPVGKTVVVGRSRVSWKRP